MIVIWGCSATRAPEFRHRNWCAKRKVTWCQQTLGHRPGTKQPLPPPATIRKRKRAEHPTADQTLGNSYPDYDKVPETRTSVARGIRTGRAITLPTLHPNLRSTGASTGIWPKASPDYLPLQYCQRLLIACPSVKCVANAMRGSRPAYGKSRQQCENRTW